MIHGSWLKNGWGPAWAQGPSLGGGGGLRVGVRGEGGPGARAGHPDTLEPRAMKH